MGVGGDKRSMQHPPGPRATGPLSSGGGGLPQAGPPLPEMYPVAKPSAAPSAYDKMMSYRVYTNPMAEPVKPPQKPHDVSHYFRPPVKHSRGVFQTAIFWVQDHPWITGIIGFMLLVAIVAGALLAICSTAGCPSLGMQGNRGAGGSSQDPGDGLPRLLVAFNNQSLDAYTLIPSVLQPYVQRLLLTSSGIQILSMVDEETLSSVEGYLQQHPELSLMVRDFAMASYSPINADDSSLLQAVLRYLGPSVLPPFSNTTGSTGSGAGRRALRDGSEESGSSGIQGDEVQGGSGQETWQEVMKDRDKERVNHVRQRGGAGSTGYARGSSLSHTAGSGSSGAWQAGDQDTTRHESSRRIDSHTIKPVREADSSSGTTDPDFSSTGDVHRRLQQGGLRPPPPPPPVGPQLNDPYYLNGSQWYLSTVGAQQAWGTGAGAGDLVVAIIDTGIDLTHPDLTPSLWVNGGEIPDNGVDDDGNGFIDDINGWDFAGGCSTGGTIRPTTAAGPCGSPTSCTGYKNPLDWSGHGTRVAGIVASAMNNARGGVGVAPAVRLMILRVADCYDGTIYASAVTAAFDYALRMGAHIVQCSFGQTYPAGFSPQQAAPWYHAGWTQAYATAIQPLANAGVLVVAAAGNEGINMDQLRAFGYSYSPCLIQLPNVLCVMSSEPDNSASSFSNYGAGSVHVAAPGRAIVSTEPGGTYGSESGTSFSAPIIAGIAALTASALGAASGNYYLAAQTKGLLMSTAPQYSSLHCITGGRGNAVASVAAAVAAAANGTGSAAGALISVTPSAQLPGVTSTSDTSGLSASSITGADLVGAAASAAVPGFVDRYYVLPANTKVLPTTLAGLPLLDTSVRFGGTAIFSSYKYTTTGLMVSIDFHLSLDTGGLYRLKLDPWRPTTTYRLLVEGQVLALNSEGVGAFMASSPGLFSASLWILNPRASVNIMVRPPTLTNTTGYLFLEQCYSLAAQSYRSHSFGPAVSPGSDPEAGLLAPGWLVQYNLTNVLPSPGNLGGALPLDIHASAVAALQQHYTGAPSAVKYMRAAVLPDLAYSSPGGLAAVLAPQGIAAVVPDSGGANSGGPLAVLASATTVLKASVLPRSLVLQAACRSCVVLINDLPVLDTWTTSSSTASPPPSPPPPPGRSPATAATQCITLPLNEMHRLTVLFAASDLGSATLAVGWAPCGNGSATGSTQAALGQYQSLAGRVSSPDLWDVSSPRAGSIGGVQCDVWASASLPGSGSAGSGGLGDPTRVTLLTEALKPAQLPLYKTRLPGPLCPVSNSSSNSTTQANDACSVAWAFNLDSLFPGLASLSGGSRFSVRCWAHWAGSFGAASGPRALPAAGSVSSAIYLAGHQAWSSSWPGAATISAGLTQAGAPQSPSASRAPSVTNLGSLFQVLAVEWMNVSALDTLTLLDGNDVVQVDNTAWQLPIPVASILADVGDSTGSPPSPNPSSITPSSSSSLTTTVSLPPVSNVVVGPKGHFSVTTLPDLSDMQPLVYANTWGLRRMGTSDQATLGLNALFTYASNLGRAVRYTEAHGFLLALSNFQEQYTLVVADSALSSTAVHAGGVTLRAAPHFDPLTTNPSTTAVQLTLPPGAFVPLGLIVKTARPDGRTLFNVGIAAPAVAAGPIDSSVWFRAAAIPAGGTVSTSGNTLTSAIMTGTDEAGTGTGLGVTGKRRSAAQTERVRQLHHKAANVSQAQKAAVAARQQSRLIRQTQQQQSQQGAG